MHARVQADQTAIGPAAEAEVTPDPDHLAIRRLALARADPVRAVSLRAALASAAAAVVQRCPEGEVLEVCTTSAKGHIPSCWLMLHCWALAT